MVDLSPLPLLSHFSPQCSDGLVDLILLQGKARAQNLAVKTWGSSSQVFHYWEVGWQSRQFSVEETHKPLWWVPAIKFDRYLKSILLHWLGQLRSAVIYVTEEPLGRVREGASPGLHRTGRSLPTWPCCRMESPEHIFFLLILKQCMLSIVVIFNIGQYETFIEENENSALHPATSQMGCCKSFQTF